MGGSDSRGSTPSSGGRPSCATLSLKATVNSPQAEALKKLKVGQLLHVEFRKSPPSLVVLTKAGEIVGGLLGSTALLTCIQNGFEYVAEIEKIVGGKCDVRIRSK